MSRRRTDRLGQLVLPLFLLLLGDNAAAALELDNSHSYELDNGLTVILLEDRNFPVVSVQMLYKIGARNEVTGKTGLAHFVEHMAFRATENFPDTDVVSSIYARGGEWHGYTWTDETTYFATVPKDDLDLLLRIEADRMARLRINPDDIAAERGAVLAEMHMYENDPTSLLVDALMFTSFLAHPYRNNTIGFEDDIDNVTHADVVQFYAQHYHPANAVLAVVGDIDGDETLDRIHALFDGFERRPATPLPHTREPVQSGMRRTDISGNAPGRQFMIAYRAPAFADPDFAAFLVLQEILGGGSGVSFLQNDWGTHVQSSGLLNGVCDDMTTWLPPSAQDYVFVIGGSPVAGQSKSDVENAIQERIATIGETSLSDDRIAAAVYAVQDQLVFDVQTTEDAAHQLAFFAGLDALDALLALPQRLESVTADDLMRIARQYLSPARRTIAWYAQSEWAETSANVTDVPGRSDSPVRPATQARDDAPDLPPVTVQVGNRIPVVIRSSDLSSSVFLKMVFQGLAPAADELVDADPIAGFSAWNILVRPGELATAIDDALNAMSAYRPVRRNPYALTLDPAIRLQQEFAAIAGLDAPPLPAKPSPSLIVVAGDVKADRVQRLLDSSFDHRWAPRRYPTERRTITNGERLVKLGLPVAQARLGYIVAAPAPDDPDFDAHNLMLYILSHGYEGRLGKEAISRRGLAYYIDASYHSAGGPGWITLDIGVDPGKLNELKRLLHEELRRLETESPTLSEIDEAKNHLLGRAISAAQSNEELANTLARDWLWYGEAMSPESLQQRLDDTGVDDVRRVASAFSNGFTIMVVP